MEMDDALTQDTEFLHRIQYSDLLSRATIIKNIIQEGESTNLEEITEVLNEATSLISLAEKDTTLVSLDAQLMAIGSSIGKHAAGNINTNLKAFHLNEFSERIIEFITKNGQTKWDIFNQFNSKCRRDVPHFFSVIGKLNDQTKTVPKIKKQKEKSNRDDSKVAKSQAEKSKDPAESDLDKTIMLIYKILKKEYKCNSKQPLNYYEFVIDPQSFSKTIENIFHFSFLIKDCLAEIHIDNDGNTSVKPKVNDISNINITNLKTKTVHQQASLSINYKMWQEIIKKYKIRKSKINLDLALRNSEDIEEEEEDEEEAEDDIESD